MPRSAALAVVPTAAVACGPAARAAPWVASFPALALLGDGPALRQRVWSGQVGVLMAFLEDRRQELIRHLDGQLREHQTAYKHITDVRELELAHIEWQVDTRNLRLPPSLAAALPALRKMRNQLAHLEVVPVSTLDDPAVLRVEHGVHAAYAPPPRRPLSGPGALVPR